MGIGARPRQFTITPSGADINALANNLENVDNIFNVNAATPDGLAHIISIENLNAFDASGRTLTIVGYNAANQSQTETITGPDLLETVYSTLYYTYISTITVSGADTGNLSFNVGITDGAYSRIYPITWAASNLEVNVSTDIQGYSLQYTRTPNISDVNSNEYVAFSDWIWVDWAATHPNIYSTLYPPVSIRFVFSNYTDGQSLSFNYSQSRIA